MEKPVMRCRAILTLLIFFIVSLLLFWLLIFPAQATSWGDEFNTNPVTVYNMTNTGWIWNTTTYTLDHPKTASNRMVMHNISQYSGGYYHVTITVMMNQSYNAYRGIMNPMLIIGSYTEASEVSYSNGNKYSIWIYNDSDLGTKWGKVALYKSVAGAATQLMYIDTGPFQIMRPYNLTVFWDPNSSVNNFNILLDTPQAFNRTITDITFWKGYAGVYEHQSAYTKFDDFFINESVCSKFSCTPPLTTTGTTITCTQTGKNYNDPGVRSWWVWGDGKDNNSWGNATANHAFNDAGTYTVSLLNENVAGSSSEVKRGYVTVVGGVQAVPDLPAVGWDFGMLLKSYWWILAGLGIVLIVLKRK